MGVRSTIFTITKKGYNCFPLYLVYFLYHKVWVIPYFVCRIVHFNQSTFRRPQIHTLYELAGLRTFSLPSRTKSLGFLLNRFTNFIIDTPLGATLFDSTQSYIWQVFIGPSSNFIIIFLFNLNCFAISFTFTSIPYSYFSNNIFIINYTL